MTKKTAVQGGPSPQSPMGSGLATWCNVGLASVLFEATPFGVGIKGDSMAGSRLKWSPKVPCSTCRFTSHP